MKIFGISKIVHIFIFILGSQNLFMFFKKQLCVFKKVHNFEIFSSFHKMLGILKNCPQFSKITRVCQKNIQNIKKIHNFLKILKNCLFFQ